MSITYVRHVKQTSHTLIDPPVINIPEPSSIKYDIILSSPYLRCRQTAEGLNFTDTPIRVDVRLAEFLGEREEALDGLMNSSSLEFGPIPMIEESWGECEDRLDEHWDDILNLPGKILVVTHGVVVNYLHQKIYGNKLVPRGRDVPFGTGFTFSR